MTPEPDPNSKSENPESAPKNSDSGDKQIHKESVEKTVTDQTDSTPGASEAKPRTGGDEPSAATTGTVSSEFETLLRNPKKIIDTLHEDRGHRRSLHYLVAATVSLIGFGLVIGTMSGGQQLWASPLKVAIGVFASGLICLPSLYIFSCLAGLELKPRSIFGILAAGLCVISLLLVGFAPIAWLFAQSTDSTLFYGVLCLGFWGIALLFGYSVIRQAGKVLAGKRRYHLLAWAGMFALVTIQMSTALRPIIGTAPTILPTEKKFFLEHWFDELSAAGKRGGLEEMASREILGNHLEREDDPKSGK